MADTSRDSKSEKASRKPYVKPELTRMNEKVPTGSGQPAQPPVPGAPAAAQASPIVPGATVF